MPKMPIPGDWDGSTYACYAVIWPDSELYRGILRGQISELTRGRFWDERTGSVVDAQTVGAEIYVQNQELDRCLMACNDTAIDLLQSLVISVGAGQNSACCIGGNATPSVGGVEGQAPPPNFVDTDETVGSPEYDTRKCAVANIVHAQIVELIDKLIAAGVDTLANQLGRAAIPVITTLVGAAVGEIITPWPLVDALIGAVIGALAGIALALLEDGVSLADIKTELETNETDYVCILYNSTDADQAIFNYLDLANTNGMTAGNQVVLGAILLVDLVNALYFQPEKAQGQIEAAIVGYTPPVDCANCNQCPISVVYGSIVQNGNVYTVSSGNRATGNCPGEWALVWFCDTAFNTPNTTMAQFTISNYSGPTIDPCTTNPVNYSVSETDQTGVATYESQTTLPSGTRCARRFYLGGMPGAFSFDITVTGTC